MQGRESGPKTGAVARKRWLPVALLLFAIAAAGGWWLSQPAAGDAAASNGLSRLSLRADVGGNAGEPALPIAAIIVEEAPPAAMTAIGVGDGADGGLADPAVNPMLVMAHPDATPGIGAPASIDGAPNPFLVAAAPARAATKPTASRRDRARTPRDDEPDLLSILLGNIKPGQPSGESDGSGLDAFIQTMEADDTGMASADENRNGRPQRTRSQQIQQNLRECPAANTAKGVKCRQEICAVYAGRDPACPANE